MTKKHSWTRFVGGLALAAAALLSVAPVTSADPGGLAAGGAGTSGTLPLSAPSAGGPQGLPTVFHPPYQAQLRKASKPAASLTGTVGELNDLIAASYSPDGSGWFLMTPVQANGTLTITFYGNLILELDRQELLGGQATANLAVAPAFNGGVLSVKPSGMRRTTQVLRTGFQSLQLQRMVRSGLVDEGLKVQAVDPLRVRKTGLEILGQGGVIRIEQSH